MRRVCCSCKKEKPFSSFYLDKWDNKGRARVCKMCCSAKHMINRIENNKRCLDNYYRRKDKLKTKRSLDIYIKKKERDYGIM